MYLDAIRWLLNTAPYVLYSLLRLPWSHVIRGRGLPRHWVLCDFPGAWDLHVDRLRESDISGPAKREKKREHEDKCFNIIRRIMLYETRHPCHNLLYSVDTLMLTFVVRGSITRKETPTARNGGSAVNVG